MRATKKPRKKPRIISFRCVLKNKLGHVLSSSFNAEVIAYPGAHAQATSAPDQKPKLPGDVLKKLTGLKKGDRQQVSVAADRAYGYYDRELVIDIPRREFPPGSVELGVNVLAEASGGRNQLFRVIDISKSHVTLDGNHPFAGQDLVFEVEATDVREATQEEIQRDLEISPQFLDRFERTERPRSAYLH